MYELNEFQNSYETFRLWSIISIVIGLSGIFLGAYGIVKKKQIFIISGVLMLVQMFFIGFIFMGQTDNFTTKARKQLLTELKDSTLVIRVCDQVIPSNDADVIREEVVKLADFTPHHSQPEKLIPIRFFTKDKDVELRIMRDSSIPTEYWIYWDEFKITSDNPIGKINTDKLNLADCNL
jgi:hypothetical protein